MQTAISTLKTTVETLSRLKDRSDPQVTDIIEYKDECLTKAVDCFNEYVRVYDLVRICFSNLELSMPEDLKQFGLDSYAYIKEVQETSNLEEGLIDNIKQWKKDHDNKKEIKKIFQSFDEREKIKDEDVLANLKNAQPTDVDMDEEELLHLFDDKEGDFDINSFNFN